MEIIASNGFLFLALACVFGLFMAWGIGANDVANAMGTSVGSKALTLKQAIIIAANNFAQMPSNGFPFSIFITCQPNNINFFRFIF